MADSSEDKTVTTEETSKTETEEKKEIVKSVFDSVLNDIKEKNDEPRILEKVDESELKNGKNFTAPKNPFFKGKTTTSPEKKKEAGKVIETVDLDLESDEGDEENSSNGKEKKSQSVTGVVFQFDENCILFEFSLRRFEGGKIKLEEDLIGQISPQNLVCNSKDNSVIPEGTKSDKISNYVQSGDEIRVEVNPSCFVSKQFFTYYLITSCFQLTFKYVKDEEEIGKIFEHIPLKIFPKKSKQFQLQF